jgi:phosphoserine/homoserine phosphotransferase
MPLIEKLEYPFTIANFLELDNDGAVTGYKLREKDGKIEMVNRFKEAGYKVIAAGDSFNDVKMLKGADKGILFKPCEKLKTQEQQLEVATNYEELKKLIEKEL